RAGFDLRPTLTASGRVDRGALPVADPKVRQAGPEAVELTVGVSRRLRGATHAPEIAHLLALGAQLSVVDDRGFAVHNRGSVELVAAVDEATARALLRAALADAD